MPLQSPLLDILQASCPHWGPKDLVAVELKLSQAGVTSAAELSESLEADLNQRLREAGLKAFSQKTLAALRAQVSKVDAGRPPAECPSMTMPIFIVMSPDDKYLFVSKLQSAWSCGIPAMDALGSSRDVLGILEAQERIMRAPPYDTLSALLSQAAGGGTDLHEMGASGYPRMLEVVLSMADLVFKKFRPLLLEFGFADSLAGLMQMQETVCTYLNHTNPDVIDKAAFVWYMACFGKMATGTPLNSLIWSDLHGCALPFTTTFMSYIYHLALPPLERRKCSSARTVAFAEELFELSFGRGHRGGGQPAPRRVIWVLGATDATEGSLAREGYYDDAGAFVSGNQLALYLVGDGPFRGAWPRRSKVAVHVRTWEQLRAGELPDPKLVVCMNTTLGTLDPAVAREWLPRLAGLLLLASPPAVILTCRCEAEVRGECAALAALGARMCTPAHMRNLYSGMAGDPYAECDDNAWLVGFRGSTLGAERLEYLRCHPDELCEEARRHVESGDTQCSPDDTQDRAPVVFWGILDLKYDGRKPFGARVRVLEMGDGCTSRFTGYGAAIKETADSKFHLSDALLGQGILVENKKLTHDIMVDSGYGHVRPGQVAYPRIYSKDLAEKIQKDLQLRDGDICVLKLCNRQRGVGVIPVLVAELDEALVKLLRGPADIDAWLREQPGSWALDVAWGSFEEHLRHWWSNECPCFVVEELSCSEPIPFGRDGCEEQFDATMRVGFVLQKEGAAQRSKPCPGIFGSGRLRLRWLGGYWKLPVESVSSADLRGRIVSIAKSGTAPVPVRQLHDIYATLGDAVPRAFNNYDFSPEGLIDRYSTFPEFGAFLLVRQANLMPDKEIRTHILKIAQDAIKLRKGYLRDCVRSYIDRNFGMTEAILGRWRVAEPFLRTSLAVMRVNSSTRYLLGLCLLQTGKPKAALAKMEESLQLDPDCKGSYAGMGVALLMLGDYERAAKVSEAGLVRFPATPALYFNLAFAKFSGAHQHEEAIGDIAAAAQLRSEALQALDSGWGVGIDDQQWTKQDDRLVVMFQNDPKAALDALPQHLQNKRPGTGWHFIGWRP